MSSSKCCRNSTEVGSEKASTPAGLRAAFVERRWPTSAGGCGVFVRVSSGDADTRYLGDRPVVGKS